MNISADFMPGLHIRWKSVVENTFTTFGEVFSDRKKAILPTSQLARYQNSLVSNYYLHAAKYINPHPVYVSSLYIRVVHVSVYIAFKRPCTFTVLH